MSKVEPKEGDLVVCNSPAFVKSFKKIGLIKLVSDMDANSKTKLYNIHNEDDGSLITNTPHYDDEFCKIPEGYKISFLLKDMFDNKVIRVGEPMLYFGRDQLDFTGKIFTITSIINDQVTWKDTNNEWNVITYSYADHFTDISNNFALIEAIPAIAAEKPTPVIESTPVEKAYVVCPRKYYGTKSCTCNKCPAPKVNPFFVKMYSDR